ncbi:MAG: glycosyltransferase [bacterium]
MKILQVLPALNSGGVERGTLEIADALVQAGHQSLVLSAGGRLVAELEAQGSQHICLDVGRKSLLTLFKVKQLADIIINAQLDIIHVRSRLPAWLVHFALKLIPTDQRPILVSTVHGLNSINRYSQIMTQADQVIAVSDWVKSYILKAYPSLDPSKVTIIHRGVDPTVYYHGYKPEQIWLDQWYQTYPQTLNKRIILLPGRLSRLKGHHEFIELIHQLVKQHHDIVGIIAGGAEESKRHYEQELKDCIRSKRMQKHIIMTGQRDDLRDLMAISFTSLSLSTKEEAFGRTTLESLALGIPSFASDKGGTYEILKTCWPTGLINLNVQGELYSKLNAFLLNPEKVHPVSQFTLDQMCEQTLKLYQNVLSS